MKRIKPIPAFWVPTKTTGRAIATKANGHKYVIHWDDEVLPRYDHPYTKEDLDSGDLILGQAVKVLYDSKR